MADTMQIVRWALRQACPLRQRPGWHDPVVALDELAFLRTYSKLRGQQEGCGVYGDVCVTSVVAPQPGQPFSHLVYPATGFRLSRKFAAQGGVASLARLCGDCPANHAPGWLAGCVGGFHQPIYSVDLQEQLDRLISRLGIEQTVEAHFPKARITWLRFWIRSPLSPAAAEVLCGLLGALHDEEASVLAVSGGRDWRGDIRRLGHFVSALERAVAEHLEVHLSLAPPGRIHAGWHTVFPHCPRCKAESPLQRWQEPYPAEETVCQVCGHGFSPAATAGAAPCHWDCPDLRDELGQAGFESFAAQYLAAQGLTPDQAALVVAAQESWEYAARSQWLQDQETARRHDRYVDEVLCSGLTNLSSGRSAAEPRSFSLADFKALLQRCEAHGVTVHYVFHHSQSGRNDQTARVTDERPALSAVRDLLALGCRERFSASLKVPVDRVERWWRERGAG